MAGTGSSSGRPCHYAVLGVARDASAADIRAAYRQLALRWHPDKVQLQGDDPLEKEKAHTRFQYIQQAYEVLFDASRRAAYDAVAFWRPAACARASAFTPMDDNTRAREIEKMARSVAKMKELAEKLKQDTEFTWQRWEEIARGRRPSSSSGTGASGAGAPAGGSRVRRRRPRPRPTTAIARSAAKASCFPAARVSRLSALR